MTNDPVFTRGDVIRLTGCRRAQVAHWTNLGVIKPAVRQTSGTGDPRLYSSRNVVEVKVGVLLATFKIPAPVLEWVMAKPLADALDSGDRFLVLFDPEGELAGSFTADEIGDVLTHGGHAISVVIDLAEVRHALHI